MSRKKVKTSIFWKLCRVKHTKTAFIFLKNAWNNNLNVFKLKSGGKMNWREFELAGFCLAGKCLAGNWIGGKMLGGKKTGGIFPGGKMNWRDFSWREFELAGKFLAGKWIGGNLNWRQNWVQPAFYFHGPFFNWFEHWTYFPNLYLFYFLSLHLCWIRQLKSSCGDWTTSLHL